MLNLMLSDKNKMEKNAIMVIKRNPVHVALCFSLGVLLRQQCLFLLEMRLLLDYLNAFNLFKIKENPKIQK